MADCGDDEYECQCHLCHPHHYSRHTTPDKKHGQLAPLVVMINDSHLSVGHKISESNEPNKGARIYEMAPHILYMA
jgi:hypothetical protein